MVLRWSRSLENAGPGQHLYLQDRHGEGSQKKKHKAKHHEDCNPIKECDKKIGAEGELQELKKTSPVHPCQKSYISVNLDQKGPEIRPMYI